MWSSFCYLFDKWHRAIFKSVFLFGLLQVINLIAALVIMRSITVIEYGLYSLFMSVAAIMMVLADLGYSSSIMAVIGARRDQPDVVNKSFSAAMQIRRYTCYLAALVGLILLVVYPQQKSFLNMQGLFVWSLLVAAMYCQGYYGLNQIYLTINSRSEIIQKVEILLGVARLGVIAVLHFYCQLNILSLATLYFITIFLGKTFTDRHVKYQVSALPVWKGEFWTNLNKFTLPKIPLLIYTTASGQVLILLGAASASPEVLGEVGALSRLGQLFAIYNIVTALLVAPNLAQSVVSSLRWKIPSVVFITGAIALAVLVSSWLFPQAFLFILGSNYGHLVTEMHLVVGAGCLVLFAAGLGTVLEARGWNQLGASWFVIGAGILAQTLWIKYGDVTTTKGLLMTNIWLALVVIIPSAYLVAVKYRSILLSPYKPSH